MKNKFAGYEKDMVITMQMGKVSEVVLKRSILKNIGHRRPEVLLPARQGEDCSLVKFPQEDTCAITSNTVTIECNLMGSLAIYRAVNDLAASGAEPVGMMLNLLLPESAQESQIKELMREMEGVCAQENIEILGGHTQITDAVSGIVLCVTGIGRVKDSFSSGNMLMMPGDDLVMTGWAAMEGTALIAEAQEKILLSRLPEEFVQEAKDMRQSISIRKEAELACKAGIPIHGMHNLSEGGVFGGLWEIASRSNVGICVDLEDIPLKQVTVEICEVFDYNPYMLAANGSLLIATPKGNQLVAELMKEGIYSAVIGRATGDKDRVVISGEEKRFLEPAGKEKDEIYKLRQNQSATI